MTKWASRKNALRDKHMRWKIRWSPRFMLTHEHMSWSYISKSQSYRLFRTSAGHEPICREHPTPRRNLESFDHSNEGTYLSTRIIIFEVKWKMEIEIPCLFERRTFFEAFLEPHVRPFLLPEGIFLGTGHQVALQKLDWTNPRSLLYLWGLRSGIPNHQIHWVQKSPSVCQTRSNHKLNWICPFYFSTIFKY